MNTTPKTLPMLTLALVALLPACDGPRGAPGEEEPFERTTEAFFASLVEETDTLACRTTEVIHQNRTGKALTFHLKVQDRCLDTLSVPSRAVIIVEDSTGTATSRDTVPANGTFRGTIVLPARHRLKIDCHSSAAVSFGDCIWEYKYNVP